MKTRIDGKPPTLSYIPKNGDYFVREENPNMVMMAVGGGRIERLQGISESNYHAQAVEVETGSYIHSPKTSVLTKLRPIRVDPDGTLVFTRV